MKKQLKMFSLLAVIIVGMFAFVSGLFFPAARATYVEGNIEQDTVWTLTDSPFVVINSVTVRSGFTLTIEPGVEVKFGGNFSLIVEGKLTAIGTQEKMITFTSNKLQPQARDWNTIKFANRTQPSMMIYAVVRYATHGITIERGNVEIRNSQISQNSQNGIYITDNNSCYIRENTIEFNKRGISIVGNSSGTTIEQNTISVNTGSGIYLQGNNGTNISNIAILNNIMSTNSKGIHIFGQVSADITRNSISYNDIGIFFENATSILPAQYNDVYSNTCGMNVSVSDPVNAEYNYWGDQSGPYHASLNPAGKGNIIHSDGVDLDFIPFLSAPNGYINARPVARLLGEKALVPPNQTVTFIATTSSDDRRVDKYFFDFGDGENSGWITLSIFEHKYSSIGTYQASLRVMDDFGVTSDNNAIVGITVQALSPLDVSLTLSHSTIVSAGQVSITVRATIMDSPVQSANITLFSITGGSFGTPSGFTDSNGYFTTTFSAPSVTKQTNFRITSRASRGGYADGSDHDYLSVVPPLSVQITLNPSTVKSEAASNGTIRVTYDANPVQDVTIRLSSDNGGSFIPETGITDEDGWFTFSFKAPQTLTQLNVTVTATATKSGYWDGLAQTTLSIDPRTLVVQITTDSTFIESKTSTNMIIQVTSDEKPVEGATVSLSSDMGGTFSNTTGTTNADGVFSPSFTAPESTAQIEVKLIASAKKSGYVDGQGQKQLTVEPAPTSEPGAVFGLPLTTLLLIIIPIVVVAIVVVLIKKRIIVFSREES